MKINNLKFSYEETTGGGRGLKGWNVLDIENLELPESGCHAVLGANGCGKTTLLKLIAGLLVPSSGTIENHSETVLVHQHPYLLSGSVFNNVAYGLKVRKISRNEIKSKVCTELERWGLSELKDRSASKLSGGERQRAAIARAMVLKPDILLLDEPTAGVDPDNIIHMEKLITGIAGSGTTVIFSTHHLDFAYRIADSIIRMKRGRIVTADQNMISGKVAGRDEAFNIFEASGTRLFCPGRNGDFRRAVFSINDVILSNEAVRSSARNVIESTVTGLAENNGDAVIELDAGFRFRARVSTAAVDELGLKTGKRVFALLKSSSIELY